jgi:hypothetical protein
MQAVIKSGRGIRRLVTLCGTVTQLVSENDRRLPRPEGDDDDDDEEEEEIPPEKKEEVQRRVFSNTSPVQSTYLIAQPQASRS